MGAVSVGEIEATFTLRDEISKQLKGISGSIDQVSDRFKDAARAIPSFGDSLKKLGGSLRDVGTSMTVGITAPIVAIGGAALKMGMNAVESENLFAVSFGSMADKARAWSETTSDALGLNDYELRRNSATIFTMSESMGLGRDAAFDMATGMTELAADMASFFNLKSEDAFAKLRSGIVGEAEPLKQLGILVDENTVKMTAYKTGIAEYGAELTQQQKVQARWKAILEQTGKAQGDLARTLDSPTNQLRILKERANEALTELGTAMLPVLKDVTAALSVLAGKLETAVKWFTSLPESTRQTAITIAAIVAAAGPLIVVMGTMITSLGSLAGAFTAAKVAAAGFGWTLGGLSLGPLSLAIGGVAAAAGILAFELNKGTQNLRDREQAIKDQKTIQDLWNSSTKLTAEQQKQLAEALHRTGGSLKPLSAEVGKSVKSLTGFTLSLESARGGLEAATPPAKALSDAVGNLIAKLSGREAQKAANDLATALHAIGGASKLTATQQKELAGELQKLKDQGADLAPALDALLLKFEQIGFSAKVQRSSLGGFAEAIKAIVPSVDLALPKLQQMQDAFRALVSGGGNRGLQSALSFLPMVELKAPDPSKLIQFGKDLSANILSAIKGGGNIGEAAGSFIGQSIGTKLATEAAKKTSGFFTSGLGKIVGSALPVIGSFLGPLAGMFTEKIVALFTGGKQANRLRDSLKEQIATAVEGLENDPTIKAALERFNTAGSKKDVQAAFDDAKKAADAARAVMQKYGLSLDDVKSAQEKAASAAKVLATDFERLRGIGFSIAQIASASAAQLNQLVIAAVTAGQKLPAALQPYIAELIKVGGLTDEAARKMLGLADPAPWKDMQAAAEKYGISVDALGKQFEQSKLDDAFKEISKDFELLTKNGADVGAVVAGMTDEVKKLVVQALKMGLSIPESMKPMIEMMARNGDLIDENGDKFEDVSKIKWTKDIQSDTERLIAKLDELIDRLTSGIPDAIRNLPRMPTGADYAPTGDPSGTGGTPQDTPGFAEGTGGRFMDFGRGMLAMLHGKEMIIPKPAGAARMTMPSAPAGGTTTVINLDARGALMPNRRSMQDLANLLVPHIPGAATVYVNR
jgi:hypothetical protein